MNEKDFVTLQMAEELKALGFNEPCAYFYAINKKLRRYFNPDREWSSIETQIMHNSDIKLPYTYAAPTISQTLRWFRDVHGLYVHSRPEFYTEGINFNWQVLWYLPKENWIKDHTVAEWFEISDGTYMYGDNGEYPTQEDAELGAINKMIEIVKIRNN
jgi:hypothetical protein